MTKTTGLLMIVLVLLGGGTLYGAAEWTGTNSNDWSDNGNWTEDPTSNSVLIHSNTNSPIVGATDTITNIDVTSGATLGIGTGVVLTMDSSYVFLGGWGGASDTGTIALSGNGQLIHVGGQNLYMGDGPADTVVTLTDTSSIDWQGAADSVFIGIRGNGTMTLSGNSSFYVGNYTAMGWGGDLGYYPVCVLNLEDNADFRNANVFYTNQYITSATVNMYDNSTFEAGSAQRDAGRCPIDWIVHM